MEIMDPTVTIQNTDSGAWLVRMEQELGINQHLDFSILLERATNATVIQVQYLALKQLQTLIEKMLDEHSR